MATNAHTAARRGESSSSRTGRTLGKTVASAVTPETLIDLVQRLGLVDMVIDKLRARIEEVDLDEFLDQASDYVKKHPESIVVGLGAATLAAGALVFLHGRDRVHGAAMHAHEDREEPIHSEREMNRELPAPQRNRPSTGSSSGARRRTS